MRIKTYAALVLTLCVLLPASSYAETGQDTIVASSVVLPQREFEFKPVLEGAQVTHDFVIKNKGSTPLRIVRVKPG